MGIKKMLLLAMLASVAFSTVIITSDKEAYHCGFDVKPGVYACEDVHLTISSDKHYKDVTLVFPYDYKNGEIEYVIHKGVKHHSRFSDRWFGKKEVDLNSFELFPGTTEITITPIAHGTFKWDAVLLDSRGNELAVLDPWFNTSFQYRHSLNLTSSSSTLTDYQVKIILNSSNIDYSKTNDDGSDLRFTWLNQTSGDEQEIPYWIYYWNESGNSEVWIKAPMINSTDNNTYYYYYGNSTPVNSKSNGTATFEFFDDFDDLSQWTVSGTAVATTVDGKTVMNMSGNPTYVYNSFTTQDNFIMFDLKEEEPGTAGSRVRVGFRFDQASDYGYTWDLRPNFVLGKKDSGGFTSLADYGSGISSGVWYHGMIRGYGSNLEAYLNNGSLSATDPTYSSGVNLFFNTWDEEIVYFDYIAVGKYLGDIITQSFGAEEQNEISIDILTPTNNSEHFSEDSIELTFSVSPVHTNENYNIYVDGVLNKTVNVTSSPWTEYFNMTTGQHNFTVAYADNESFNDTVVFTVKDFLITSVQYDSTEYELMYSSFNATIKHLESLSTNESILYYFNGTNSSTSYSMTITVHNATTDYATVTVFTPFLGASSYEYYNFTINATANDSSYEDGYNNTQKIIVGYYIDATNVSQPTIVEGGLEESNITVVMKTDYAVVTAYSTLNGTVTEGTETGSNGEKHYWKTEYHVPSVNTSTDFNVTYFITVSYGGITATRQYSGYDTITVEPISIGYCDATNTVQVLNFTAWDEQNYSKQLQNTSFKVKIDAAAEDGNVVKTFGFEKAATSALVVCIPPDLTYYSNISAFAEKAPEYVKRSKFTFNTILHSQLNDMRIYLLNSSIASVIDFYVKNEYEQYLDNKIIKVLKYFTESNSYVELFSMITGEGGHAVGKVIGYDEWYRFIIIDEDNDVLKDVDPMQISSSSVTFTVSTEGEWTYSDYYGISHSCSWNNQSRVLKCTVSSSNSVTTILRVTEVGLYANETYCETNETGTSYTLVCDLSNSSVTTFKYGLYYYEPSAGVELFIEGSDVNLSLVNEWGLTGLAVTLFIVLLGATLYVEDPRISILVTGISVLASYYIGFITLSHTAIIALFVVIIVIIYKLRKG